MGRRQEAEDAQLKVEEGKGGRVTRGGLHGGGGLHGEGYTGGGTRGGLHGIGGGRALTTGGEGGIIWGGGMYPLFPSPPISVTIRF